MYFPYFLQAAGVVFSTFPWFSVFELDPLIGVY